MRALVGLASLTVLIALGGTAQAAKPKAAPGSCKTSVADFVKYLGEDAKDTAASPALTPAEYNFAKDIVEKHSASKKVPPGDGAVFVVSKGQFVIAFTKGKDGDAKICAVIDVPVEVVSAILASDAPKVAPKAATKKPDPNVLSL